jgi:hypothetical protein
MYYQFVKADLELNSPRNFSLIPRSPRPPIPLTGAPFPFLFRLPHSQFHFPHLPHFVTKYGGTVLFGDLDVSFP